MPTFVLNDETQVNSYGFRVKNAGLKLERFRDNPVMLDTHKDWSLDAVIGKWENIRFDGTQLQADSKVWTKNERGQEIHDKVEDGFIKGCSIGLLFDRDKMVLNELDGKFDLEESELMEGSLCPVPSSAKSVQIRLYNKDTRELMTEDEVKLALSAVSGPSVPQPNPTQISKEDTMEKFQLSMTARTSLMKHGNLGDPSDAAQINLAIEAMAVELSKAQSDFDAEKKAHETLKGKWEKHLKAEATSMVETAILEGKLTAGDKEAWITDAQENPEMVKRMLSAIPAKKKLNAGPSNTDYAHPKTVDDFEKLDTKAQLAFKADFPEEYANLFK